jgi:predicted DsbA family dithiol-disulfide isomerase
MNGQRPKIAIHVISDTMCPWCFIGKRRLEKALALAPDIEAAIHWRPYQLDPSIPQGGMDRQTYLTNKFGAYGASAIYAGIAAAGAEEGIPFAFEKIRKSPNTLDSHRLLHWAEAEGRQNEMAERLFQLYFIEGEDIGDRDVLAKAAVENGMDGAAIRARLDSGEDKELIAGQIVDALELGIDGVPFFTFGGRTFLSGAQAPKRLEQALRAAASQGGD